jgi:hypothetical protein
VSGEGGFDGIKCACQRRQQARPQRSQPDAAFLADEQRRSKSLLETFYLVGNRGLRHSELGGGGSEILGSGRGLEGPDRRQWRKSPHPLAYKADLSNLSSV